MLSVFLGGDPVVTPRGKKFPKKPPPPRSSWSVCGTCGQKSFFFIDSFDVSVDCVSCDGTIWNPYHSCKGEDCSCTPPEDYVIPEEKIYAQRLALKKNREIHQRKMESKLYQLWKEGKLKGPVDTHKKYWETFEK